MSSEMLSPLVKAEPALFSIFPMSTPHVLSAQTPTNFFPVPFLFLVSSD